MPAVAIKISEDFATAARTEAEQADRSLTGQVEHWGKLGRGAEALLPPPVVALIKRFGGDPQAVMDPELPQKVRAAFDTFTSLDASAKRALIGLDQKVLFEPDPDSPAGMIRITPDGLRTRGRMEGRQFVPINAL